MHGEHSIPQPRYTGDNPITAKKMNDLQEQVRRLAQAVDQYRNRSSGERVPGYKPIGRASPPGFLGYIMSCSADGYVTVARTNDVDADTVVAWIGVDAFLKTGDRALCIPIETTTVSESDGTEISWAVADRAMGLAAWTVPTSLASPQDDGGGAFAQCSDTVL